MKKLLAILVLVLIGTVTYAQWSSGGVGPNIWNTSLAGNLGIGTAAPIQTIHAVTALSSNVRLESTYAGAGAQALGQFQCKSTANGDLFIMAFRHNAGGYSDMLQSCYHSTWAGNGFAEFMYFRYDTQKWEMRGGVHDAEFLNVGDVNFNNTGTGRVGIGVTAFKAGVKFQVNGGSYFEGRVRCHEVEVALAPTFVWPDYVFNTSYKLKPLYEVENFVMANKHLEGVPSQEEISNNGVKLGEMNATLLQKVEELTLYMINLQKENDALKVRVSNLEK